MICMIIAKKIRRQHTYLSPVCSFKKIRRGYKFVHNILVITICIAHLNSIAILSVLKKKPRRTMYLHVSKLIANNKIFLR